MKLKKQEKTALIVGASSGLGLACIEAFSSKGYQVIGTARRNEKIVEFISKYSINGLAIKLDVQNSEDILNLHRQFADNDLWPHIIVYCAGINRYAAIESMTDDDWNEVFQINTRGVFTLLRSLLPSISDGSRIVLVGSTAGLRPFEWGTVYCASKTALHGFASALREELRPRKISVTLFMPGSMPTEFWTEQRDDIDELLPVDYAAELIVYAVEAPPQAEVSEIIVRPLTEI